MVEFEIEQHYIEQELNNLYSRSSIFITKLDRLSQQISQIEKFDEKYHHIQEQIKAIEARLTEIADFKLTNEDLIREVEQFIRREFQAPVDYSQFSFNGQHNYDKHVAQPTNSQILELKQELMRAIESVRREFTVDVSSISLSLIEDTFEKKFMEELAVIDDNIKELRARLNLIQLQGEINNWQEALENVRKQIDGKQKEIEISVRGLRNTSVETKDFNNLRKGFIKFRLYTIIIGIVFSLVLLLVHYSR